MHRQAKTRPATACAASLTISRGAGGLVDNRVDGYSVSGSADSHVDNRVVRTDDIESDEEQHKVDVSGANTM
jgi:hypothetical protein